ncbi:bacteriochlorophyll 4-vinyl reductase [Bacillus paranthracis]|uniref:bacteriochlorophyll 4-vinyl reductase n=1 Tax=Bacillus paranthracis TaxID=2026186 RepID=UPI0008FDC609|nr:bacteriochlorophyll 4-vinyl reductase [Bacillus paranthracis]OJE21759.1 bacteriochlorophyll 4-vinyl reductase [Bacillus paranthracis]
MANEFGMIEVLITNAVKLPGVKVNRDEFLAKNFSKNVSQNQLAEIIEKGPINANIDKKIINKVAKKVISNRTMKSSSVSFAAGVPGGLAMAATIPADTAQFFGMALRLSQELGYIYGYEDFWDDDGLDVEKVNGDLVLFLGVMFGVGGATATIKVLSSQLSKEALKKLPNKALMKTFYYPIIKKIASYIGVKVTKDSFAKGISKVIPVVGGVVSGGLTFASMTKMGNRLSKSLEENMNLSSEDVRKSFEELKKNNPEIIDVDFEELDNFDEIKI